MIVQWPQGFSAYNQSHGLVPNLSCHGSLLEAKKDRTGYQYNRNRYYDPQSGRFTQEDPIGLAGGLNAYGFANGDPVNFSDPFGLCIWDGCIAEAIALAAASSAAIRFIGNKLMGRPAAENVVRDAVGGAAVMGLLVGGGAAMAARAAPLATAGTGLTGRIVGALERALADPAVDHFAEVLQET